MSWEVSLLIDEYRDEGMLGGLPLIKFDYVEISTKGMMTSQLRNHEFYDINNFEKAWLNQLARENNFFHT